MLDKRLDLLDYYHVPKTCEKCGGIMIFKGVGEYQCEECDGIAYDDYGKVRLYLESHKGATAVEIEQATGVTQKTIRQMLKESRLQVAEGSKMFLRCEVCGKNIRFGRFCPECEIKVHRGFEEQQRKMKKMHGVGMGEIGDEGHRRFMRTGER